MAKRIVIIGGGVAGLTAGVFAKRAGFDSVIYEKNPVAGGECTGWDQDGYHIDNCIHWLMGVSGETALNRIWKTTGAIDNVEIIHNDNMYTSELQGQSITLWQDIDRTERELMALSPEDSEEIKKLMALCRLGKKVEIPAEKPMDFYSFFDMLKLTASMKDTMRIFKACANMDTQDMMDRFKHPLIRCMISDFCTKDSLASSFPMAYGNFVGGDGGVPKGGSRAMALRMQERFVSLGGEMHTGVSAEKLILENGKAVALQLASGELVQGDYFVCSCDPDFTFSKLLPGGYIDPLLAEIYANPADYPVYGMLQAAYAVDCPLDVMQGEHIIDCSDIREFPWLGERLTVKTYGYEPGFAPEGKQIVQFLWGLDQSAFAYWEELYKDKTAYKAKKEALCALAQKKIEERFPEYAGKMRLLDAWTPMTYRRWCNAYKGYNQAYTITKRSRKNAYLSPSIKGLDNVFLSGQWLAAPGGLPGAAIQGKFSIQRICKIEKMRIDL